MGSEGQTIMTKNVAGASLIGAVKLPGFDPKFSTAEKQKKNMQAGFYWIQRKSKTGHIFEPELAYFHRAEEGRSFYLGKWQVFDHISKQYHVFETHRVICHVPVPIVV